MTWKEIAIDTMRIENGIGLRVPGEAARRAGTSTAAVREPFRGLLQDTRVDEIGYRLVMARVTMNTFDKLHFQCRSGFLDEASWQAVRASFVDILARSQPGEPEPKRLLVGFGGERFHPALRREIEPILASAGGATLTGRAPEALVHQRATAIPCTS